MAYDPLLDTGDANTQQFANVFGGTAPTQKNQQITQEDWNASMANRPSATMDSSTFMKGPGQSYGGAGGINLIGSYKDPAGQGGSGLPGTNPGGLPGLPGAVGDINSYMNQVKGFFTPLDEQAKANIRQGVEATFAPRFADQNRTNDYRTALFAGGRAQAGDLGFGASDLTRNGIGTVGDYNNQKINELRNLQEGEVNDRITKAQDAQYKQTTDYLSLADKFRTNEQSALQQQFQNQLSLQDQGNQNSAAKMALQNSVLEQLGNLDASTFGNLPLTDIESAYGLQPGFLQALKTTKEKAAKATNAKDLSEVFNSGVELATKLPIGQSFSLKSPIDGDTISFTGSSPDELQIISDANGIFKFNKTTGVLTKVSGPTNSGSGGGGGSGSVDYAKTLALLNASKGSDNFVNTDAYKSLRSSAKDKSTFDANFGWLLNPNDPSAKAIQNIDSSTYVEKNIPSNIKQDLISDITNGHSANDIVAAYPEVSSAYIKSLYDTVNK